MGMEGVTEGLGSIYYQGTGNSNIVSLQLILENYLGGLS